MRHPHALIAIIYFSSIVTFVTSLNPASGSIRELERLSASARIAIPSSDETIEPIEPPSEDGIREPSNDQSLRPLGRNKRKYDPNDQRKRSDYEPAYAPAEEESADEGYCVMGNVCGSGGGIAGDSSIPCHAPRRPATLNDTEALAILRNICPDLFASTDNPAVCCSPGQIRETDQNLVSPRDLGMGKCPSCYHNFRNLHCNMVCSPKQQRFVQVIKHELVDEKDIARLRAKARDDEEDDEEADKSSDKPDKIEKKEEKIETSSANKTEQYAILEVNYFLDKNFMVTLFDSCKNVKSVMGGMLIDVGAFTALLLNYIT